MLKTSQMIPGWGLQRPKGNIQMMYDFMMAPLRMVLLPDHVSEKCHMTSLRAERFAMVLPELKGAVLDIGAGDNLLLNTYIDSKSESAPDYQDAKTSVGVDVFDWGAGCTIIESSDDLPFENERFDTVAFIACINHIPERLGALKEAVRVLKPGGKIVVTMINRFIGELGHMLWWYSEDKHRHVDEEELMGMDEKEVVQLFKDAGIDGVEIKRFCYGMNTLYTVSVD